MTYNTEVLEIKNTITGISKKFFTQDVEWEPAAYDRKKGRFYSAISTMENTTSATVAAFHKAVRTRFQHAELPYPLSEINLMVKYQENGKPSNKILPCKWG